MIWTYNIHSPSALGAMTSKVYLTGVGPCFPIGAADHICGRARDELRRITTSACDFFSLPPWPRHRETQCIPKGSRQIGVTHFRSHRSLSAVSKLGRHSATVRNTRRLQMRVALLKHTLQPGCRPVLGALLVGIQMSTTMTSTRLLLAPRIWNTAEPGCGNLSHLGSIERLFSPQRSLEQVELQC